MSPKTVRNLAKRVYRNFFMNNIYKKKKEREMLEAFLHLSISLHFVKSHHFQLHLQKHSSLKTLENDIIYYMMLLQEVN